MLNKTTKVSSTSTLIANKSRANKPQYFLTKIPVPENHKRQTYFLRCNVQKIRGKRRHGTAKLVHQLHDARVNVPKIGIIIR